MSELFPGFFDDSVALDIAYAAIVTLVGAVGLWWVRRRINRVEKKRKQHINRIKRFDAVRTDSPVHDPAEQARERGVESIETRFGAIRRILLPTIIALWLFVLLVPFLARLPATLLSFVLGLLTVVVGIAARPFIENVIAGLVLSFAQPVRIGDTILIDGKYGTVEDISLTYTVIKIWDWRRYIIPNHRMLQKELINYSIIDRFVWAYVEFWVSHDTDLAVVKSLATGAVERSGHHVPSEPPKFWVMGMEKDAVRCWVAGWADTPSGAWLLAHDVRTTLVLQLREHGFRCHTHEVAAHGSGGAVPPDFRGTPPPPQSAAAAAILDMPESGRSDST